MIKNIHLENIGPFRVAGGSGVGFGKLSLVYGDNGRGKTTLAEVLRAAGTEDPAIINARRGLNSTESPRIILIQDEGSKRVTFQDGKWDGGIKSLAVFDDSFVERNVCSGLEVKLEHRQNLHDLILGETGVELARREEDLVKRREQHITSLREKEAAIPSSSRFGISVDDFCNLAESPDVDAQIQNAERSLRAAHKSDAVKSTPSFTAVELPEFDTAAIAQLLQKDLPGLTQEAERRVQEQIKNLGQGGEGWIADGVGRLSGSNGTCPFCGQDVSGLPLIADYQAHFSAAYSGLKKSVADTIKDLERVLTNAPTDFEREVRVATERRQFWAEFCDIPEIAIDTEAVVRDWRVAGNDLLSLLRDKSASPLEPVSIGEDVLVAIGDYDDHRRRVKSLSDKLTTLHSVIELLKRQAADADIPALEQERSSLHATKARYSPEMALPCDAYLQEKSAKESTDKELDTVRKALAQYRKNVFPALQETVNAYLDKFGVGLVSEGSRPSISGVGRLAPMTY